MLLHLGSRVAVDEALYRMAKSGEILRIGRGLYVRPVEGKYGRCPPNSERVVASVAKLKGEETHLAPAALANRFGLTPQVPVREIYHTSGSGRVLKIGEVAVEMRRAPKWLFSIDSQAAREAASVLNWVVGNGDAKKIFHFLSRLSSGERADLERARPSLPEWTAEVVSKEMKVA